MTHSSQWYFNFPAISEAIVHILLSLTQKPISESDIDPNFKTIFQHIAGKVSDDTRVNSKTWQL